MAQAERAKGVGSQAGCGGGQGGVEGWVGMSGRVQVAGQVRWLAWSGGGPGYLRGMDLQSKECSGVNIVT